MSEGLSDLGDWEDDEAVDRVIELLQDAPVLEFPMDLELYTDTLFSSVVGRPLGLLRVPEPEEFLEQ